jgi:hypothetical protein
MSKEFSILFRPFRLMSAIIISKLKELSKTFYQKLVILFKVRRKGSITFYLPESPP